ncbi:MAG: hypothetical protein HFP81_10175 [Methylococcales symbiont of Hymedesmia sp. n. MRB-2018]|nr:MAG: hypothetical protein HFP78_04140 [Methylococcales symbiont of Hymedesmia sp. n. MRB-2018]KAF3982712.1 MAG: hypothetical protein HFP81_10175 [Methylococcales symbiont of Hymedesmia sp. n. MRB-2018]
MTNVIKKTMSSEVNKTIFNAEKQLEIRENLKEAVGYETDHVFDESFKPEVHHEKIVPFEGNVYSEAGNSLSTEEINKMYAHSTPSLWWLASQSLIAFVHRVIH